MAQASRRSSRKIKPKTDPDFILAQQMADIERQVEETISSSFTQVTRSTPSHGLTTSPVWVESASPVNRDDYSIISNTAV